MGDGEGEKSILRGEKPQLQDLLTSSSGRSRAHRCWRNVGAATTSPTVSHPALPPLDPPRSRPRMLDGPQCLGPGFTRWWTPGAARQDLALLTPPLCVETAPLGAHVAQPGRQRRVVFQSTSWHRPAARNASWKPCAHCSTSIKVDCG